MGLLLSGLVFQSTLPRRERRSQWARTERGSNFNPRSREGSDAGGSHSTGDRGISIHAPAKGATSCAHGALARLLFQSTLPRRERRPPSALRQRTPNFNPRSREGSDVLSLFGSRPRSDFNPRSREGSDCPAVWSRPPRTHFNPRSREGSDGARFGRLTVVKSISIHAPAKGATAASGSSRIWTIFQSTLPRRERPSLNGKKQFVPSHFNPRSREGSDGRNHAPASKGLKFQSTLPRRERPGLPQGTRPSGSISIHAPAKGATLQRLQ